MSTTSKTRRSPAAEVWALMFELWQGQRGRLMRAVRDHELSPPQLFALGHLRDHSPLPMGELAVLLHCDNSNVTGIVDRLEQRGLVERRAAAHDRRVRHLVLTDAGLELAEQFHDSMAAPPAALERLPAADQRTLRDILRRVVEPDERP